MWKLGQALVVFGYLVPIVWVGWVMTQPGDGSLGSGILLVFQFGLVLCGSLLSLVTGALAAAAAWRRGAHVRPLVAYLVVGGGVIGATAIVGALVWFQLSGLT